ncbi:MAG: hypothetical protein U0X92_10580 [Anaerolineales bacterium]
MNRFTPQKRIASEFGCISNTWASTMIVRAEIPEDINAIEQITREAFKGQITATGQSR